MLRSRVCSAERSGTARHAMHQLIATCGRTGIPFLPGVSGERGVLRGQICSAERSGTAQHANAGQTNAPLTRERPCHFNSASVLS